MKHRFTQSSRLVALAVACGLLLAGCNSKDPEIAGKQMADTMCQAYQLQSDKVYALHRQVAAEIKAGTIKTRVQYADRSHELLRPLLLADSLRSVKIAELLAQLNADFPQPEARQIAGRFVTEGMDECDKVVATREQTRPVIHLIELSRGLQGPAPTEAPTYDDNGNLMTPPNLILQPDPQLPVAH
ncbi:hypothetical protein [Hymenobacter psoromatis]|uniref:hypothetical protein n=1 Tax=Hymenobacter psoromatis TaxID=1484116 RepID=UPI001CC07D4D|nr:hypothetical protein [Hymenobacter psoromatis]